MMTLLAVVHLIFALLLIALVLLQDPKSSGTGGVFGSGGSNTVLGATGGANFLEKLTRYSAVIFGITCMTMTIMSQPSGGSVLDSGASRPAAATAPAQRAPTPPATSGSSAPAAGSAPVSGSVPGAPAGK
jgi:preprotein translocase subunit SecG